VDVPSIVLLSSSWSTVAHTLNGSDTSVADGLVEIDRDPSNRRALFFYGMKTSKEPKACYINSSLLQSESYDPTEGGVGMVVSEETVVLHRSLPHIYSVHVPATVQDLP
jgi:hypothetical protein